MLTADLLNISIRQVLRHRRRYRDVIFLITLGIAGSITVQATGDSVLRSISRDLEILGNSTLLKVGVDRRAVNKFFCEYSHCDVEMIRRLKGVRGVSPFVCQENCIAENHQKKTTGTLFGIEAGFLDATRLRLGQGSGISEADVMKKSRTCVLGQLTARELFGDMSAGLGQKVLIAGRSFTVVGILGGIEEREFLDSIMIPISVARGQVPGLYEIRDIYVRATHWQMVRDLCKNIKSVLEQNHSSYRDTIVVRHFPKRIEKIETVVSLVKKFLLAALIVALLLGAIGTANVMLSAVQERTIEIGLRKIHGATEQAIKLQFLVEAVMTTCGGAVLGIVTGLVLVKSIEIGFGMDVNHRVLLVTVVSAALFGVGAGIVSGFAPARRASSLDPADALRFE
jgi:putative ABC transport system permease protein